MQFDTNTKYRQNALGHLVPEDKIDKTDKKRDDLVCELIPEAETAAAAMRDFKASAMKRIQDFADFVALKCKAPIGGVKGNITLTSYDGSLRVIRAVDEFISFNEKMTAARAIILDYIANLTKGADTDLAEIVSRAFETNKDGHLATARILALRAYNVKHPEWRRAMDLISQSIVVQSTGHYIRFYKKDGNGKWQQIPME